MRLNAIVIVTLALAGCGDSADEAPVSRMDAAQTAVQSTDAGALAPCRQAGNYQAGKEGSYQPCCPGLVEVLQRSRAEVNGALACVDLPLRVYACVEGSCGDGRCEAPENVPCGCAVDCPSVTSAP